MLQTTTECGCTITLHDDGTDARDYCAKHDARDYGESASMHPTSCYVCAGDYSDAEADHAFILPCDAIGHRYCETDRTCYGCGERARDAVAADFFTEARAARDDVAAGAYPSLSPTPTVRAPYYVNGTLVGKFPAQIIGLISRETRAYLVQYPHNGETRGASSHELVLA